MAAGRLPRVHPRVLQVLLVPLRRLDQPFGLAPLLRHEEGHGRAPQEDADHLRCMDRLHPRTHRRHAVRWLLVEGRDHRQRRRQRLHRPLLGWSRWCSTHGHVHDPCDVPHLLRRAAWCRCRYSPRRRWP